MATETVNQPTPPRYQFQAFRWRHPSVDCLKVQGDVVARFVEQTQDISNGVRELLQLLEWDDVEQETVGERDRLLSPSSVCHLRRLAIAALEGMATDSERTLEWMLQRTEAMPERP